MIKLYKHEIQLFIKRNLKSSRYKKNDTLSVKIDGIKYIGIITGIEHNYFDENVEYIKITMNVKLEKIIDMS